MASPTIDGHSATANGPLGTTASISLTTTLTNDIIVVAAYNEHATNSTARTVTGISGGGLTFAKRKAVSVLDTGDNTACGLEVWWALAASALTSTSLTVSFSGTSDDYVLIAFGVNGCYTAAPWDSNASLPGVATKGASGGVAPSATGLATSNANDLLISVQGIEATGTFATPTGFTLIDRAATAAASKEASATAGSLSVSSLQSGLTVTAVTTSAGLILIVDALTADAPPAVSQGRRNLYFRTGSRGVN